ncbi:MAG: hypothetical protein FRX48_01168 [Lasallia pustulata]|uniref:SH3 domain-containing protein n=1 Tax=Lasallia pustulata TaxID=136370 RepID=A0A5M8PXE3_9LECA|nr:MAG: hypothetical protein FRX48_01168 [Lasallia pustulata]
MGPPSLATASALYAYTPADAGDLALLPNDQISITEFMNADWAKGRNERTGMVGIFPRSYVRVVDEKSAVGAQAPPPQGMGYGNMPLEVAQGPGEGRRRGWDVGRDGEEVWEEVGECCYFRGGGDDGGGFGEFDFLVRMAGRFAGCCGVVCFEVIGCFTLYVEII